MLAGGGGGGGGGEQAVRATTGSSEFVVDAPALTAAALPLAARFLGGFVVVDAVAPADFAAIFLVPFPLPPTATPLAEVDAEELAPEPLLTVTRSPSAENTLVLNRT